MMEFEQNTNDIRDLFIKWAMTHGKDRKSRKYEPRLQANYNRIDLYDNNNKLEAVAFCAVAHKRMNNLLRDLEREFGDKMPRLIFITNAKTAPQYNAGNADVTIVLNKGMGNNHILMHDVRIGLTNANASYTVCSKKEMDDALESPNDGGPNSISQMYTNDPLAFWCGFKNGDRVILKLGINQIPPMAFIVKTMDMSMYQDGAEEGDEMNTIY